MRERMRRRRDEHAIRTAIAGDGQSAIVEPYEDAESITSTSSMVYGTP
jgi:hypothetical protein